MHDRFEQRVNYYTDGLGKWWKVTWARQCDVENILYGDFQGVRGHRGCHWNYRKGGSYAYWLNEDDPSSIENDVACGCTPPRHNHYVSPDEKAEGYFMRNHSEEEIVDASLIARLENDDTPEPNATIDRPASPEEIEELRALGRITE